MAVKDAGLLYTLFRLPRSNSLPSRHRWARLRVGRAPPWQGLAGSKAAGAASLRPGPSCPGVPSACTQVQEASGFAIQRAYIVAGRTPDPNRRGPHSYQEGMNSSPLHGSRLHLLDRRTGSPALPPRHPPPASHALPLPLAPAAGAGGARPAPPCSPGALSQPLSARSAFYATVLLLACRATATFPPPQGGPAPG